MTIVFASLALFLLYLCTLLLYLHIKKGKLQQEEDDFRTKSSREMKGEGKGLFIGQRKKTKDISVVTQ